MTPEQTPQLSLQELAEKYLEDLRISSASLDPRRDRDRLLGFKAGYAAFQATVGQKVVATDLLPNLDKSTENWSKIKDKDEWLSEVRGDAPATVAPPVKKCDGNCGMNYCDEYGCIENKPDGDVSHLLAPPVSGDEIEKSFQWLAEVNANGVDNKEDHKIIICDGDYYWELDQDGDQPISPAKLSEMFLKRNSATPIKETVTDGVEFADWIVSSGYILSHYDPKNKIMYHHRLDGHKPITDVKYYYTAELYTLFQKSKTL